jgi:hypothetical protein
VPTIQGSTAATPIKTPPERWSVVAVPQQREAATVLNTRNNGLDDVFVRDGQDRLVNAHGRVTNADGIKPGDKIRLQGIEGRVEGVDSEPNTFLDGVATHAKPAAIASGIAVGGTALYLALTGTFGAWGMPGLAVAILGGVGGVTLAVAGAGLAIAGVAAATRKGKLDAYEAR